MSCEAPLPYAAPLDEYERQAEALLAALRSENEEAAWRFKWEHPLFRGKGAEEVRKAALGLTDARLVIAHDYAFETWAGLVEFTSLVRHDDSVDLFERAVEAVVSGDVAALRTMLRDHPELVTARSRRRHHATLLHYVGANGVEGMRQKTPPNAVEVAELLLDAGSEADALADMYDGKCTTMSMLVSSSHPAEAGLQTVLAETLLDHGASVAGAGTAWESPLMTALVFGYLPTALMLARRGAPVRDVAAAAGLGRVEETARLLPEADAASRQNALTLAAMHGHADVVRLLLDAGEDPNRFNNEQFHAHTTPVHQAVWGSHLDVVRLFVERGARLDVRDTLYQGTPLDWALYGKKAEVADYLRSVGAPTT